MKIKLRLGVVQNCDLVNLVSSEICPPSRLLWNQVGQLKIATSFSSEFREQGTWHSSSEQGTKEAAHPIPHVTHIYLYHMSHIYTIPSIPVGIAAYTSNIIYKETGKGWKRIEKNTWTSIHPFCLCIIFRKAEHKGITASNQLPANSQLIVPTTTSFCLIRMGWHDTSRQLAILSFLGSRALALVVRHLCGGVRPQQQLDHLDVALLGRPPQRCPASARRAPGTPWGPMGRGDLLDRFIVSCRNLTSRFSPGFGGRWTYPAVPGIMEISKIRRKENQSMQR